jgi:hypothetical protein
MSTQWKMIVYIAADNSLYEDALVSLHQITQASRLSDVEILVQFDGPTAELSSRYKCEGGRKTLYWQAAEGYTDDRRTRLDDFLTSTVDSTAEKKKIFLVLWGHGAGMDHVYVYKGGKPHPSTDSPPKNDGAAQSESGLSDEPMVPAEWGNGGNANLYVKDIDLKGILGNFATKNGGPIDILGFDACLLGFAEICHEMRGSVSRIVASDEELPKGSWPYDLILSDLTKFPGMDPDTLSALIIGRFMERYSEAGNQMRTSLSSYNLAACDPFANAFKSLAMAMLVGLATDNGTTKSRIVRARDFSRTADDPKAYVDVVAFCKELKNAFPPPPPPPTPLDSNIYLPTDPAIFKGADDVLNVVAETPYIIYHRDFEEDGSVEYSGLGLYFPKNLAAEEVSADEAPVQPADLFKGSILDQGRKTPPDGRKTPQDGRKNPPDGRKDLLVEDGTTRQIASYRIVWSDYIQLEFNTYTGWSSVVEKFLPSIPKKRGD